MAIWRRSTRRWSTALLTLALAALLASCTAPSLPPLPWQRTDRAPLPDAQQIIHLAMRASNDASNTFDPAWVDSYVSGRAQLVTLLYSGLYTLDAHLRPVPALATSYSVSADGLRYTFHLRAGARFTEGTPLTSADVAFSFNRVMSGCLSGNSAGVFADVKDQLDFVQVCRGGPLLGQRAITTLIGDALLTPDPSTVIIVLARPDSALLEKLAEPYSLIVERSFVTSFGAQWTSHLADGGGKGTSGMYHVAAWKPWAPYDLGLADAAVTLVASRDYWGAQPMLRQVDIALREGQSGATTSANPTPIPFFAVKPSDELVFDASPPNLFTLQVSAKGLRFVTAPERGVDALAFDPHTAPLDDVRLREALALALDKTALAKIDNGTASNHLIPLGTGDYPAKLSGPIATAPLTGDVAQAQALWRSYVQDRCGGVASRCPTITAFYDAPGSMFPIESAMLARWRAILPGIQLKPIEQSGLLTDLNFPEPGVNYAPWFENYPDPQDWLQSYTNMPGYSQPPYAGDAQADALVARAEASGDPVARLALYQQAENTLLNDAAVVPVAQIADTWGVKPTVVNFPVNPAPWIAPDAWARIYLTALAGT